MRAATQTPDSSVRVIVQGPSASDARHALNRLGSVGERLGVVDAAAGTIRAGDLPQLAAQPGLVITPDNTVVLDAGHQTDTGLSSGELWPHAVGVDQFWGQAPKWKKHHGNGGGGGQPIGAAPTIAFVDSGIEPGRTDFGDRLRHHSSLCPQLRRFRESMDALTSHKWMERSSPPLARKCPSFDIANDRTTFR